MRTCEDPRPKTLTEVSHQGLIKDYSGSEVAVCNLADFNQAVLSVQPLRLKGIPPKNVDSLIPRRSVTTVTNADEVGRRSSSSRPLLLVSQSWDCDLFLKLFLNVQYVKVSVQSCMWSTIKPREYQVLSFLF